MAAGTRAGDEPHASCWRPPLLPLPAATAVATPEEIMRPTASSTDVLAPPPSDMFATAGLAWFAVTQSIPAMTPLHEPEPPQSSTRTATSFTSFAMPYLEPPTVPDTCVPWPLQSCAVPLAVTAS